MKTIQCDVCGATPRWKVHIDEIQTFPEWLTSASTASCDVHIAVVAARMQVPWRDTALRLELL